MLAPIRFVSFRRNEVNSKAPRPAASVVAKGGSPPVYYADDDRAQRNTVALRDVDYLVEARISLTDRAGPGDTLAKYEKMFHRRLERGQHFHHPYFGCREFPAAVSPGGGAPPPIDETRDLGIMLWDIEFTPEGNRARFFNARLASGVLEVPARPESGSDAAEVPS